MEQILTSNDLWNWINVISSLITFVNMVFFYIMIFGNENLLFKRPKWEQLMVKIGFLCVCFGTLLNVMIWAYPPINEIIINMGLAFIFTWASIFHWAVIIKKDK